MRGLIEGESMSEDSIFEDHSRSDTRKPPSLNETSVSPSMIYENSTCLNLSEILQMEQFDYSPFESDSLPEIFVAMTPFMSEKLKRYHKAVYYFTFPLKIMVNDSPKDISMFVALNSNLEPSILTFSISEHCQTSTSQIFEKMVDFISKKCEITSMVIFSNNFEFLKPTVEKINEEMSLSIELQPTLLLKENNAKKILISQKINKKPYLKKEAVETIERMLTEKDEKRYLKLLEKFKEWNLEGYEKFNDSYTFLNVFELPLKFYGFGLEKNYDNILQKFAKKFMEGDLSDEKHFVNKIIEDEYEEMEALRNQYCYEPLIFKSNSRVETLKNILEPNPFREFVENYKKALSLKETKISHCEYITGGKTGTAYRILKEEETWGCECLQTLRIGIPCEHLLKICCIEKIDFGLTINSIYLKGNHKTVLRVS